MLTQWTGIEVDLEQRRTGAALPSGIEKVDNFKALRGHNRGEFAVELQGIRQGDANISDRKHSAWKNQCFQRSTG